MREADIKGIWTGGTARKWRLRTDQELRELYKDRDLVADIGMDWVYIKNGSGKEG
jgi:hypothetical protein